MTISKICKLPNEPTIYDHLVLSLRPKDLIATFNWDPFLYQAFVRNGHVGDMPYLAFLHGTMNDSITAPTRNWRFSG
jgi:hypothetical protein